MSKKNYCPAYPKPVRNRWQLWWRILFGSGSMLEQLTETGYRMHMGRVRAPGGPPTWAVNDPKAVRKVMIEQYKNFPKHQLMDDLLEPLLGRSIFTANGEAWKRRRQMMEPAFEATRTENAFPLMRAAADAFLARLRARPTDEPWDVEPEISHFAADVIHRTTFSKPLDTEGARRIFNAFSEFQRATTVSTEPRYRPSWWRKLTLGRNQTKLETEAAAKDIRAMLLAEIEPRYKAYQAGNPGPENDILSSLLAAREEGTGRALEIGELLDEITFLYLAGHETSASALAWTLHLLSHDKSVQKRAQTEVDTVLPRDEELQLEHLGRLELVRRIFREGLRMYPPVSFVVREATEPACLRDHDVSEGSLVFISPWLIQRHRKYWDRPDEFDPDRFGTDKGRASASSAYLPFSLGPRVCVGAAFAQQESLLALATILREFDIAPVPGHDPMPVARLTLRSDIGIRLMLKPRKPAKPKRQAERASK